MYLALIFPSRGSKGPLPEFVHISFWFLPDFLGFLPECYLDFFLNFFVKSSKNILDFPGESLSEIFPSRGSVERALAQGDFSSEIAALWARQDCSEWRDNCIARQMHPVVTITMTRVGLVQNCQQVTDWLNWFFNHHLVRMIRWTSSQDSIFNQSSSSRCRDPSFAQPTSSLVAFPIPFFFSFYFQIWFLITF